MHWIVLAALGYWFFVRKPEELDNGARVGEPFQPRDPLPETVLELQGDDWTEIWNSVGLCKLNNPADVPEDWALCALTDQVDELEWPPVAGDHPSIIEVWDHTVRFAREGAQTGALTPQHTAKGSAG
jgi:hypothetical protein